ncbi:hypothetical protein SARC_12232 [Sphaeroforma arctica JP610]|uniref:Uncharacterized protein n=1 Tax=Sphaeroforma arctica JP610 TaxID=667725 RepID=A0A0L0FEP4_9EUKA|nr:hypothetical protein SARC_12232 [Sphaeroforma arctica JP610]KNC75239.1 hypothetical protein SARC_12232 [Sphaeroforma arctica JP610]|eukprot:XP_014149141.1 hypothetical protein SARC_12232 [Sphaeroforma arctica JP610]
MTHKTEREVYESGQSLSVANGPLKDVLLKAVDAIALPDIDIGPIDDILKEKFASYLDRKSKKRKMTDRAIDDEDDNEDEDDSSIERKFKAVFKKHKVAESIRESAFKGLVKYIDQNQEFLSRVAMKAMAGKVRTGQVGDVSEIAHDPEAPFDQVRAAKITKE